MWWLAFGGTQKIVGETKVHVQSVLPEKCARLLFACNVLNVATKHLRNKVRARAAVRSYQQRNVLLWARDIRRF